MTQQTISVIGVGNIGARHLQSLAALGPDCGVWAADLSQAALDGARKIVDQEGPQATFNYVSGISGLPARSDVLIVATNADVRLRVLQEYFAGHKAKYVVLEKVAFQVAAQFDTAQAILDGAGAQAWVNCPRRMWPVYLDLKKRLGPKPRFHMVVNGISNLGCNGIHYVDVFQYLAGGGDMVVDGSRLDRAVHEGTRAGHFELSGHLHLSAGDSATACFTSSRTSKMPVGVSVFSDSLRFHYEQSLAQATFVDEAGPGEAERWEMPGPRQSELTRTVVGDLLQKGACDLATLAESRNAHEALLGAFIKHLEDVTGSRFELCPVT